MPEDYDALMMTLDERFFEGVVHESERPPAAEFDENLQRLYRKAFAALCEDLLSHIYVQDHLFFERLIIDLLLAMGYGGRRRDLAKVLGRSHDGGVDGVIAQDELGLDLIFLQAKRLKPGVTVPVSQVRDFVGSLEGHGAGKGVFFTTGQFTAAARSYVDTVSRRVVLIDGRALTELMIRHNIGVRVRETYQFKETDIGYFARNN